MVKKSYFTGFLIFALVGYVSTISLEGAKPNLPVKYAQAKAKTSKTDPKNNIKIKDAVAGQRHTIALSEDGEVYTWGFGRKNINLLMKVFMNPCGPTGHGKDIP